MGHMVDVIMTSICEPNAVIIQQAFLVALCFRATCGGHVMHFRQKHSHLVSAGIMGEEHFMLSGTSVIWKCLDSVKVACYVMADEVQDGRAGPA